MKQVLVKNSVQCLDCGEVLVSKHRHDFAKCSCSNQAFTDGGLEYQRIGAVNLDRVEKLSIWQDLTPQEVEERKKFADLVAAQREKELWQYFMKSLEEKK